MSADDTVTTDPGADARMDAMMEANRAMAARDLRKLCLTEASRIVASMMRGKAGGWTPQQVAEQVEDIAVRMERFVDELPAPDFPVF